MQSTRTRLDRFISVHTGIFRKDVRAVLAQGRVTVNGKLATGISQVIDQFAHVLLDDQVLQARTPLYIMLNKPAGVVSATTDAQHKTVVDLLDHADRNGLHIAGRLDFNSTGLVLLTNDGRWSRRLSAPENHIGKRYRVTLEHPIGSDYAHAFLRGMYFAYEGITTRPAKLRVIDAHTAEVRLVEGRYHQIKRMFGHFDNRVLQLHRVAIGDLELDSQLLPGQSRDLSETEVLDALCIAGRSIPGP
ncbi:MAG: 16S rRNA pseudouridine516 synthase [Halieaceae bacterium]